jgi:hypothetical protein
MSNPKKLASAPKREAPTSESALSDSPQESSSQSINREKETTIHAVENFLKQNSGRPSRQCGKCGEPMQYMEAYFWLDGTDVASTIPLPFCPACEADVLTALRRKRGTDNIGMVS